MTGQLRGTPLKRCDINLSGERAFRIFRSRANARREGVRAKNVVYLSDAVFACVKIHR